MEIKIPYAPHPKQAEVHNSTARFKIVAAGRRSGKTTLALNEIIRQAVQHPQNGMGTAVPRSWFVCQTYEQARMIGWKTLFQYLPQELIARRDHIRLQVELINGHLIEFKGAQEPSRLRGAPLVYVVLDEYGCMSKELWEDVLRASLADFNGGALFIGTPGPDGSPHFHDMWLRGKQDGKDYASWLFHTTDNPNKMIQADAIKAKQDLPPDIYQREYEADFDVTSGLLYDNFRHAVNVIPNYEPDCFDFIVGSIDPGLNNPTGALLVAWDREGCGRIFKEYYKAGRLAGENAVEIKKMAERHRVAYWVIDKASQHRDQISGSTVYNKYAEFLRPLIPGKNDPGSVWAGIDEVKKLFQIDPRLNRPRLQVTALCNWFLWEIGRYARYKRKWFVERNEEEKPRKLNDHLMDCIRNMVMTKPWIRPALRMHRPVTLGY